MISKVVNLLAELEDSAQLGNIESAAKKPRKVRVYTDEQKAALRARMIAAREANAKAKEEAEVDSKAEEDLEKALSTFESKPVSVAASLPTSKKISTIPRTDQINSAKQSA